MGDDIRGVDHVGVLVADLESAGRFLSDVLGLELDREAEVPSLAVSARFYRCGPILIEIFEPHDPAVAREALGAAPAKIEHIAIRVESLPAALERLGGHGVRWLHGGPVVTGPNDSAYSDPATSAGIGLQLFAPRSG